MVLVKSLFRYEGLDRRPVEAVHAGDIAVVAGNEELSIGDTLGGSGPRRGPSSSKGLSRSVPLRLAHLPLIVLGAWAADRLLRGGTRAAWRDAAAVLAVGGLAALGLALAEPPPARGELAFAGAIVLGTLFFALTRHLDRWRCSRWRALVYGQRFETARARGAAARLAADRTPACGDRRRRALRSGRALAPDARARHARPALPERHPGR